MSRSGVSRRAALFAGAAAAALAAIGATGVVVFRRRTELILSDILRRNLPKALVNETALAAFISAFSSKFERKHHRWAQRRWLRDRLTPGESWRSEQMERDVITAYLIGSDIFEPGRPKERPVKFIGVPEACANPFYRT